jgi:hypothetical protein
MSRQWSPLSNDNRQIDIEEVIGTYPNARANPVRYCALDQVESYVRRFVVYPSKHAIVAHVLWIAHTHLMDCWETTPRLAVMSAERGSGKTRLLEVAQKISDATRDGMAKIGNIIGGCFITLGLLIPATANAEPNTGTGPTTKYSCRYL